MATTEFDTLHRRNWSGYSALIWAMVIGYAWAAQKATGLPKYYFLLVSAFAAWMLIVQTRKALAFYLEKQSLKRAVKVPQWTLEQLNSKHKPNEIYLGRGFLWNQTQTQKVFDILKGHRLVESSKDALGAVWIHGIGTKEEEEIYFPITHSEGHTLILGTTGAGKTTLFRLLIAQAILRGEAVLIINPPQGNLRLESWEELRLT